MSTTATVASNAPAIPISNIKAPSRTVMPGALRSLDAQYHAQRVITGCIVLFMRARRAGSVKAFSLRSARAASPVRFGSMPRAVFVRVFSRRRCPALSRLHTLAPAARQNPATVLAPEPLLPVSPTSIFKASRGCWSRPVLPREAHLRASPAGRPRVCSCR